MNYSPSLLSTRMIYVTTTLVQTWRSLCSTSPLFSKGRITASKEEKNIISWGMCRVSVMPMGRLSVLSTPVAGSVMSHTRRGVFLIVFSLQPLTGQLHNKRPNSLRVKLLLGPTQNISKAFNDWDQKIINFFPLTPILFFLPRDPMRGLPEEAYLIALYNPGCINTLFHWTVYLRIFAKLDLIGRRIRRCLKS